MKLAVFAAMLSLLLNSTAGALDRVITPICTIGMRVEPRGAAWPLGCVDGTPYFQILHKRTADDHPVRWTPKTRGECVYFEMAGIHFDDRSKKFAGGDTTLKNLGAGSFNEEYTKFTPDQTTPPADRPPAGFLTADFTTNPPSVKLDKLPGKSSNWKIRAGEQDGDWYVEIKDGAGKTAWLSIASKPDFVVPVGNDEKGVDEFRRAVLSYDSKAAFRIVVQNDGP